VIEDTIPLDGHGFVVAAGGELILVGNEGLARLDPVTGLFTAIPNPDLARPEFVASDGEHVWVGTLFGLYRVDPADGSTVKRFDFLDARAVAFADDAAWVTTGSEGVVEIDLATNEVRRSIAVPGSPLVPFRTGDALWVTDFDSSSLWRIEP
jgi:hypothetical protein